MWKRNLLLSCVMLCATVGESASDRAMWPVISHLDEWRQFLAAAPKNGAWPSFERFYLRPNDSLLSEFMRTIGTENATGYFEREVGKLDLAASGSRVPLETERRLLSLIESANADALRLLPGAEGLPGQIHVWRFFPLFDGMGTTLRGKPTVMLNVDALTQASDEAIRVLTAHEIHHAVRSVLLGSHIPAGGIFQAKAGDHMVSEGLAVAFSEAVYPGLELHEYFPAYSLHPEKLEVAVRHEAAIGTDIVAACDRPISDPAVAGYFYGSNPDDDSSPFRNSAYLIGYRIIRSLVSRGKTLDELTRMPAGDILKLGYRSVGLPRPGRSPVEIGDR